MTEKSPKFSCSFCHYSCSKQSEFNKHLTTKKHVGRSTLQKISNNSVTENAKLFVCTLCDRAYKHRETLFAHKKICIPPKASPEEVKPSLNIDEILTKVLDHQKQFMKEIIQEVMVEVVKNMVPAQIRTTNNTDNSQTTNSHNKTFNLQVFLNETCKDAMNMTDFIDSIKIQLADLIDFEKVGFAEGISNIITKNLKSLGVTERPIQCTDLKREVVYIKDDNKWEKDDENKNKLRRMIKRVAYKNEKMLPLYREKYPGYNKSESKHSDQYCKIVIEAYGGKGGCDSEKEDKIIRNITKATLIDKTALVE